MRLKMEDKRYVEELMETLDMLLLKSKELKKMSLVTLQDIADHAGVELDKVMNNENYHLENLKRSGFIKGEEKK